MAQYENVPAHTWEEWTAENDAFILDVRRPDEWALGTLSGANLIVMHEIPARLSELPRDRPILCVCRSGDRSGQVAAYLAENGYTAANLTGGLKALGLQR